MADLEQLYGRLIIVGKDPKSNITFPIDKKSILLGRWVQGEQHLRAGHSWAASKHVEAAWCAPATRGFQSSRPAQHVPEASVQGPLVRYPHCEQGDL
jgi:hypothetical protein